MQVGNLNHQRFQRRESAISPNRHRTFPITDFRLINWKYNGVDDLATPLLWPKKLERLAYETGSNHNLRTTHSPSFQFSQLVEAIKPHEKSLVGVLVVTTRDYVFKDSTNIETLTAFTSLKRLAIPHENLRPHAVLTGLTCPLPPQLEELQLQHGMTRSANYIEQRLLTDLELLAWQKPDQVPALRLVVTWYQPCANQDDTMMLAAIAERIQGNRPKLERISSLFWDVGAKFTWVSAPELTDTLFGRRLNAESS